MYNTEKGKELIMAIRGKLVEKERRLNEEDKGGAER